MALYEVDGRRVTVPASGRFWVADNAVVTGNVRIEEEASVWFGTVARGDNEPIVIGARSNVQDGCVLHADPGFPLTIGPEATIGHRAVLHGCTIGRGALIGMGAVVLNGASIGEECLVGAGALIPEGKQIPPRSVVLGAPGKVMRQVTDKDLAMMRAGVEVYVRRWQAYASSCRLQLPG
ncbi:MAG TPA: gamma carbonic anhydrase family protein [Hyphomicrobiaceae bacterium]|nr:gamma carbonic anhydrase family protein [Hyphomicrobiaceae bacterium]